MNWQRKTFYNDLTKKKCLCFHHGGIGKIKLKLNELIIWQATQEIKREEIQALL